MTRLGLVGDQRRSDAPAGNPEPDDERAIRESLSRLAGTLSAHGEILLSPDLALDLLLNRIVEQARLATNTTGAAIALRRGEHIVCRATTGVNAPDLGVRLHSSSGLSGACFHSGQVQICDDTETDSRVDPIACRQLGVRAILIVPVLNQQEALGVLEVFSSRPNAFGDRDVQTLQTLSQRAVESIARSVEAASPRHPSPPAEPLAGRGRRRRDPWTLILTVMVLALALLLGWLLGRHGWQRALLDVKAKSAELKIKIVPQSAPVPEPTPQPPASPASLTPAPKISAQRGASPGGLVVYQNGKVIYRAQPQAQSDQGSNSGETTAASEVDETPALELPPQIAERYLMQRVGPLYPETARQQHIQGQVLLHVRVSKGGSVRELKVISGDPQLAAAAAAAVRRWQFLPFLSAGKPVEFATQITVDFRLP